MTISPISRILKYIYITPPGAAARLWSPQHAYVRCTAGVVPWAKLEQPIHAQTVVGLYFGLSFAGRISS